MSDYTIIKANEARLRTDTISNKKDDEYMRKIFEDGIFPAIEKGEYRCLVHFIDPTSVNKYIGSKECPESVLIKLRELGYQVEYGKTCFDQRDGYETDKSKLEISWK